MMLRVRCTEIEAWVSDCAYGASAYASSATFWNRSAGSFSRQRYTIAASSPGNGTVIGGSGSVTTLITIDENVSLANGAVPCKSS